MRTLLLPFLAIASLVAGPPIVVPDPQGEFDSAVEDADRVTILRAATPTVQKVEDRLVQVVVEREQVKRLIGFFKFSGEYAVTYRDEKRGEESYTIMNCLCLGDFSFSFAKGDKEIASITVHHWAHVRSKAVARGIDVKITEASAKALREYLERREPARKGRKTANKAPEPTTMAVTPRAPSPTSE